MKNGNRDALYCAIMTVLLFGLTVFSCSSAEKEAEILPETVVERQTGMDDEKTYCTATLEDDFADDSVLIVLKKETDFTRVYTLEDFPEVQASEIADLTGYTVELILKQLEAERTGDWSKLQHHVDYGMLVNIEVFRRILCFTLTEKSKENVLETIKRLEKREDVRSAGPNYQSSSFDPPGGGYL